MTIDAGGSGYLKRRDRNDGQSDLVDESDRVAAVVATSILDQHCRNGEVRQYRWSAVPGTGEAEDSTEAEGNCPDCGGLVIFLEGELDARCYDLDCGGIARR